MATTEADIDYLRSLGVTDFYVWASVELPDAETWSVDPALTLARLAAAPATGRVAVPEVIAELEPSLFHQ